MLKLKESEELQTLLKESKKAKACYLILWDKKNNKTHKKTFASWKDAVDYVDTHDVEFAMGADLSRISWAMPKKLGKLTTELTKVWKMNHAAIAALLVCSDEYNNNSK